MVQNGGIKLKLPDNYHQPPHNTLLATALLKRLVDRIVLLYDDKMSKQQVGEWWPWD